ncbi:hypothetical protein SODALDRAFT_278673 [Sodiomyces alkalinus F11]|uniref:Vacuolar protein sorting-associated protein 51 homolog n=1 Tax=Sodiomyces alkalinus (strain CBS 110278 / VKM F-3762 / F11) TaxID=1314773 RepID=A0A3N2PTW2_SODAK|nr:hypothetical protein SODALDRAFT_278673 [Sodiomyces alkalinus F11]ROT37945.1 hypothetical protein SODALDRAFT_278673 [Sodiomyces alkalinus F11]
MSTIASPREPSATRLGRRLSSQPLSPTPSNRPSLEVSRSQTNSPRPTTPIALASAAGGGPPNKRANRAALREYYNLKKQQSAPATPTLEVTQQSEVPTSELDASDFDADAYVQKALENSTLEELLKLYTRVLGEVRALDAEKKALVYDNYSKLISATETIHKMRSNMDPLNPMAATLDPAIAQIYTQALSIREALRATVPAPDSEAREKEDALAQRRRARRLAREVLDTPERLRKLVAEGEMLEARKQWEMPRRLLEVWKAKGIGGNDVLECLEEGDAAVGRAKKASTDSGCTAKGDSS